MRFSPSRTITAFFRFNARGFSFSVPSKLSSS